MVPVSAVAQTLEVASPVMTITVLTFAGMSITVDASAIATLVGQR
jgi:hypothetical protein